MSKRCSVLRDLDLDIDLWFSDAACTLASQLTSSSLMLLSIACGKLLKDDLVLAV